MRPSRKGMRERRKRNLRRFVVFLDFLAPREYKRSC
jgi:hypothetical protein